MRGTGFTPEVYILVTYTILVMTDNPGKRIQRLHDRIENSDKLDGTDRQILQDFSDRLVLLSSKYGQQRHEHLLRRCTIMAEEVGGLADALEDRKAAEDIVRWIHRNYDNEETNRDYRGALRIFGKRTGEDDSIPESIEWIPGSTSASYQPEPDPRDMLRWEEDIQPMLESTTRTRNEAMVAVAWDAGARSGEFRDLAVGDVTDGDHGLQITVDGKTGQRTVTLIPSVPHLQRWLRDHPDTDDPEAPLWSHLQSAEPMSYNMFRKILEGAAERADVTKPVTLTNFRKSSAAYLASQGVNQAVLEEHHGWRHGSRIASRYISVFADANQREIARAHGVEITEDEEDDPTAPLVCPRCEKQTPRDEPFCMWCRQAIDPGAKDELAERGERQRRALLGIAKDHPELLDRLEEMEPIIELIDGRPEIIETAREFVEETERDRH